MPKPICVSCQRFYRPEKNGYRVTEMMPRGAKLAPPGTVAPEAWKPYKIWAGDLWRCPGCGNQIVVGFGSQPLAEHYEPDFEEYLETSESVVNDC